MNKIFLPELLNLKVKNFTLYPNGLDFSFDFVKGVNLIIGGNGMGKTTFVNLIKYGVIGNYKREFDFNKTYKERRIEKRISYPNSYFRNRKNDTIFLKEKANIELEFNVYTTKFKVVRCLEEISLLKVSIFKNNKEEVLNGEVITQEKYDALKFQIPKEKSEERKKQLVNRLESTLQFIYEKKVEEFSGIDFDSLIFLVNKVLYFGEDHKTILWGIGDSDVQTELFNKYFNDPKLASKRREALRKTKYFDSRARHKSEDMRAIKKVLDKYEADKKTQKTGVSPQTELIELKTKKELIQNELASIQKKRKKLESDKSILKNDVNLLFQKIELLELEKEKKENNSIKQKWVTLHKNYNVYLKNIQENEMCPMCNQEVDTEYTNHINININDCIVCNQKIRTEKYTKEGEESIIEIKELTNNFNKIRNSEAKIKSTETVLKKLDATFNKKVTERDKISSQIRTLQFSLTKKDEPKSDINIFYEEINKLEIERNEFYKLSEEQSNIAKKITNTIDEKILENTHRFSSIFSGFASDFLGVDCQLSFVDFENTNEKRFLPKIDGKIRYDEEELSESQRFFVDHSFRMSILTFFYDTPTFYIVETPDSSLDISYEINAANVFLKFLKNPNSIIITSNFNNSEFLDYLVKNSNKVNAINLLDIGKKSNIQGDSSSLERVNEKIKKLLNER